MWGSVSRANNIHIYSVCIHVHADAILPKIICNQFIGRNSVILFEHTQLGNLSSNYLHLPNLHTYIYK